MTERITMQVATAQNKAEEVWERRRELGKRVEGRELGKRVEGREVMKDKTEERVKVGYRLGESIELGEDEFEVKNEVIEVRREISRVDREIRGVEAEVVEAEVVEAEVVEVKGEEEEEEAEGGEEAAKIGGEGREWAQAIGQVRGKKEEEERARVRVERAWK
jgi:hypothetical protein